MTKERKKYIDSFWMNTPLGEFLINNAQLEKPECAAKAEKIMEQLWDPEKPWISLHDRSKEFAKDFASLFKGHEEWADYVDLLYKESPLMSEIMRVAAVTNWFIFQAEEEILKRDR